MSDQTHQRPVVIDLNVNRSLLNPNFECYRVSIDPMVTYCQSVPNNVNELRPNEDQYSYLHASMASQYNHLFADPFSFQTVFFATNSGQIICVSIEVISGDLTEPKVVYTVPNSESSLISMSFPTNELSLISLSNPNNPSIHLLSTLSRSAAEPWLPMKIISLTDYDLKNTFHLCCSHSIDLINNCLQIDFILSFVDKTSENNFKETSDCIKSSFISALNWFTIDGNPNDFNSWKVKRLRRLNGKDWPKYVAFDVIGSPFLCLVSNKDFTFVYDSEQPIVENNYNQTSKPDPKPIYTYSQSLEDICLTFKLPSHLSKSDVTIDLKPTTIAVKIKDVIEFEGTLFDTIEANSSVWTLLSEKDYQLLEITVNKGQKGSVWKEFIKGDKNGIEIVDNETVEEIHKKLIHLTNEMPNMDTEDIASDLYNPVGLEECDFSADSLVFSRYNGNTHSISHRIDLTGNQWLFSIPTQKSLHNDSNELPYFVVRHDVDGLVWAPQSSADVNQFKVVHLATFAAFGYVQASKTNTRFIVGANDFKFVAIADGLRHVYVYRQPIGLQSGELRNRRTGQEVQTIASQHVINLNDCQYIIGIHATNEDIFVLSNDKIFLIKI